MEDTNLNKINVVDDEKEEEITICPYKKVKNFLGGFFGGGNENPKLSTEDEEQPKCPFGFTSSKKNVPKGKCPFGFGAQDDETNQKENAEENDKPKCPFGFTSSKKTTQGKCPFGFGAQENTVDDDRPKCPFGFTSSKKTTQGKCPFGFGAQDDNNAEKATNDNDKNDSDDDSGEDEPRSGCPVMGRGKLDPKNKDFEEFFEVPCFGNYDFMFLLKGGLSQQEWLEKTKKMRKYPRHLKYTLFYQSQEKLKEVHKAEFPRVFFIYDDIKQKGIRLYNRKKYHEALEHLNYSYGLLRWIEFKDKTRQTDFVIKPSLDGILDEEIVEKRCYLDAPDVEEESYKACVVYILEVMAYCHMELRQYKHAIECLDECEETVGDLVPDVFFRRAQARMYNKNSTDEDMLKAKEDLQKALASGKKYNEEIIKHYGDNFNLYKRPLDLEVYSKAEKKLDKIIEERLDQKTYNLRRILGKVYGNRKKNENDINEDDDAIFFESCLFNNSSNLEREYRVLNEMKNKYDLAVKFFTETKNKEQLDLTYKEFEGFHETFEQFKYFYKFKIESIDPKVISQLSEDERKMLKDPNTPKIVERQRANICEYIFIHGKFNAELFKYALDKILEEDQKKLEEKRKKEEALRPKVSWSEYLMKISKGNFGIYLSVCFIILTFGAIGFQIYSSNASGADKGFGNLNR